MRHEVAGRALIGVTRVPAGEGRDRDPQLRRPDARALVAVGIHRGDERDVGRADLGWQVRRCPARRAGPKSSRTGRWTPVGEAHARDGGVHRARRLGGHRGAVGQTRHRARRRLDALAHPAVEVDEGGPQERRVVHHAERVAPAAARVRVGGRRRERAGRVLGAREEVLADPGRRGHVAGGRHVGVDERAVAAPVLGRGVDREDARRAARGRASRWSSAPRCPVIGSSCSPSVNGNRLPTAWTALSEGWPKRQLNSPRRPPATCGITASHDGPARLVLVEPEVEQVAQEAAALRDPEDVGPVDLPRAGIPLRRGRPSAGRPRCRAPR